LATLVPLATLATLIPLIPLISALVLAASPLIALAAELSKRRARMAKHRRANH
jgi:hypothetical protein